MFQINKGFDFIQAFDLFYKVHRVFIMKYHNDLKQFMEFVDYYVFGFRDSKVNLTSRMEELNLKLLGANENNNWEGHLDAELDSEVTRMFAAVTTH